MITDAAIQHAHSRGVSRGLAVGDRGLGVLEKSTRQQMAVGIGVSTQPGHPKAPLAQRIGIRLYSAVMQAI